VPFARLSRRVDHDKRTESTDPRVTGVDILTVPTKISGVTLGLWKGAVRMLDHRAHVSGGEGGLGGGGGGGGGGGRGGCGGFWTIGGGGMPARNTNKFVTGKAK